LGSSDTSRVSIPAATVSCEGDREHRCRRQESMSASSQPDLQQLLERREIGRILRQLAFKVPK
jgi:hypothetical protein